MLMISSLWKGLLGRPYLLLVLTTLMWAGNAIAGRLAVGQVSPMVLTGLRWVLVIAMTLPFQYRSFSRSAPDILPHWKFVTIMAACGFTAFNALFYTAAYSTTAVNIAIFQGAIPVVVLIGTVLFFHNRILFVQALGVVATLMGAVLIAIKADLGILKTLAFNIGDVWMVIACTFYAGFTLGLRRRPANVSGFSFFIAMAIVAFLTSLPLVLWEITHGTAHWPTLKGWLVLSYIAIFPSLLSQIFFMRSVELIGPARAGVFVNLVPVFGSLLAVVLLGEPFAFYHAAGLALVLGGIGLSERKA